MLRRLFVTAFVAAAIVGCGSGSPSASPAGSPSATPAGAAPTAAPTQALPSEPAATGPTTMRAACRAVAVRKLPSSTGTLIVRLAAGAQVNVIEVVPGDPYEAGRCGSGGDAWLKIDAIGGKAVMDLYGVAVAYAAAGFFE